MGHWIDKDPIAEAYFENLLDKILQYAKAKSKDSKHIIKITEDDVFAPAEGDVWELLLGEKESK